MGRPENCIYPRRQYYEDESQRSAAPSGRSLPSRRGTWGEQRWGTGPIATATEVFSTRSGHKKVEKDSLLPPDEHDGLMTISVQNRIVKKDTWHEESLALERMAMEGSKGKKVSFTVAGFHTWCQWGLGVCVRRLCLSMSA